MVKLTWRLSLLFGLTLLFCGYCILLGALAGAAYLLYSSHLTGRDHRHRIIHMLGTARICALLCCGLKRCLPLHAGLTDACFDIPTDLPEHAGHYVTFLQWCGPHVA